MKYLKAVLVGLGLAQVATLITTIYLHRVLSHKAIRLHPALTMFMRLSTWMLTSISPREWVAVHRKHHNFSDVDGDPHSPHIEGYWKIMIANVYYYRREANDDLDVLVEREHLRHPLADHCVVVGNEHPYLEGVPQATSLVYLSRFKHRFLDSSSARRYRRDCFERYHYLAGCGWGV